MSGRSIVSAVEHCVHLAQQLFPTLAPRNSDFRRLMSGSRDKADAMDKSTLSLQLTQSGSADPHAASPLSPRHANNFNLRYIVLRDRTEHASGQLTGLRCLASWISNRNDQSTTVGFVTSL